MNPITIEFREVLMIVLALVGGYFYMARVLTHQFKAANDTQLQGLKEALGDIEARSDGHVRELRTAMATLDSDVRRLQQDLPREYVRKEDYVQAMATVYAKIDTVQAGQQHLIMMVGQLDGAHKRD